MENVHCIKDTNGRYEGRIELCATSLSKPNSDWKWDYTSYGYPMSGNLIRENSLLKVQELLELNALAEYDLNWEVVEFTRDEMIEILREQLLIDESLGSNFSVDFRDIQKACVCKHRKNVRDIKKKYKSMFKELVN